MVQRENLRRKEVSSLVSSPPPEHPTLKDFVAPSSCVDASLCTHGPLRPGLLHFRLCPGELSTAACCMQLLYEESIIYLTADLLMGSGVVCY